MAAAPLSAGAILLTYLVAQVVAALLSAAGGAVLGHGAVLQVSFAATPCAVLGCCLGALVLARRSGRPCPRLTWPGAIWAGAGLLAGLAVKFAGDLLLRLEAAVVGPRLRGNNPLVLYPDLFRRPLPLVILVVALVALVPVAEELFFRGLVYGWLRARLGPWPASLIGGLLFAVAHGDLSLLPPLWLAGVALCWLYERSGSLLPGMAAHAALNAAAVAFALVP